MVKRLLHDRLLKSKKSILLLGPRQVGKSTLIRNLNPDLTIDLSSQAEFLDHSSSPRLLEEMIRAHKPKSVFIDEVQRLPDILNTVQHLIDSTQGRIKFYLTGSSARKLRRGRANLLPGRILSFHLSPLCLNEIRDQWSLQRGLQYGFLPEAYLTLDERTVQNLLSTYAAVYLKEEIQAEALVRNIPGFARFLTTLASHAGQSLDYSKISRQSKVSRTNLARFFEILEDTLIAFKCNPFLEAKNADIVKHPKFYFFDVGVLNGILKNFSASADRKGALMEHLVLNQILNSASASDIDLRVTYFRTRHGAEVDFIIQKDDQIWAVEVKAGAVGEEDLRGLKAFRSYRPDAHCLVVCPSEGRREIDGIPVGDLTFLLKELSLVDEVFVAGA